MSVWNHRVVRGALRLTAPAEGWIRPGLRSSPVAAGSVLVLEYLLPLGNLIHMTPVFEAMKRRERPLTITVATRGLGLGVLEHSPFVDHLIETPDPLANLSQTTASLRAQLAAQGLRPDGCMTGVADQRTKIALLALRASSGWRGGFTLLPQLYQHPLVNDKSRSLIANNLQLASLVGAPTELLEPRVFYSAADVAHAHTLLDPLRAEGRKVLAVVSQNSGGQRTGWHADRWIRAMRHAHDKLGYELAFMGTADEVEVIDSLRAGAFTDGTLLGRSLAGRTSVTQLAATLAMSDLVLTLDTGTMHVGRTTGVPMVVLGPSWQKPHEWLPLGKPHIAILRGEDRVGIPENYMLDEISAESVIAALDRLGTSYPASEASRRERIQASLSKVDLLARQL